MKKTLIAIAVAAAVPALAQAQSSVTLSGNVKVGLNSYKLSNGAVAASNGSGLVMGDGSSRWISMIICSITRSARMKISSAEPSRLSGRLR